MQLQPVINMNRVNDLDLIESVQYIDVSKKISEHVAFPLFLLGLASF